MMRRSLTFAVTRECTRRCSYCYVVGKGPGEMSLEVARAAVDRLLEDPRAMVGVDGLTCDFLGGEPLLRADLIDEIIGYLEFRLYRLRHPWFGYSAYSISSNGDLYLAEETQRLIRNWSRLEVMISIDGPEDVHDRERGAGSYASVMRAFPAWRAQHPRVGTKTTFSPSSLPDVARSIAHLLIDLRLPRVDANPVFEGVWRPEHAAIYEAQLELLAERLLSAGVPLERCSLFGPHVGRPAMDDQNWCGAGRYMLCVDETGTFYPCFRFTPATLHDRPPITCGNVIDGIDWNAIRQFEHLTASAKSPLKCQACSAAGGCAWCTGFDYDEAGTIHHRATNICALHQARARVNERLRDADKKRSEFLRPTSLSSRARRWLRLLLFGQWLWLLWMHLCMWRRRRRKRRSP